MRTLPSRGLTALTLVAIAGPVSGALSAQQAQGETPVCTARALPLRIYTADPAARVAITLSESIGKEATFEPDEASGLELARAEDLRRVALANQGEPPRPIEMADDGKRVTVFLTTVSAQPGVHAFTVSGADGKCTGTLNVAPAG